VPWIITVYRDDDRHPNQLVSDILYSIDGNTAFANIIKNQQASFCSNDLGSLDGYLNENPIWMEFYNSVLVVPIRYQTDAIGAYQYMGLLSADSLNAQKQRLFDNQRARIILEDAARTLASYMVALTLYQSVQSA
jgi:hypothetical protein